MWWKSKFSAHWVSHSVVVFPCCFPCGAYYLLPLAPCVPGYFQGLSGCAFDVLFHLSLFPVLFLSWCLLSFAYYSCLSPEEFYNSNWHCNFFCRFSWILTNLSQDFSALMWSQLDGSSSFLSSPFQSLQSAIDSSDSHFILFCQFPRLHPSSMFFSNFTLLILCKMSLLSHITKRIKESWNSIYFPYFNEKEKSILLWKRR